MSASGKYPPIRSNSIQMSEYQTTNPPHKPHPVPSVQGFSSVLSALPPLLRFLRGIHPAALPLFFKLNQNLVQRFNIRCGSGLLNFSVLVQDMQIFHDSSLLINLCKKLAILKAVISMGKPIC